ncbi:similar to hypothetical protein MGC33309, isoform CRA_b [Rattus norvegicus]|uniref:Uncharacterized protein RGD1307172 n=1 Tax=Rattus norvegicus TaxID=10116 RepID=A6IVX4_RAT|nr:similar to hypothetical protein MGC33309, isoform CRA_b [Rattus norvegicus]
MTSLSVFRDVPIAQKLEGSLLKIYRQDDSSVKMFLAYKVCMTEGGHPWVSLVVRKTRLQIAEDPSLNYEYLPLAGLKSFIQASLELLFGKHSQAIVEKRVGGVHIVGESGAFQLGAQFLKIWRKNLKTVCIISCQNDEGVGILVVAALSNQHLLCVISQLMDYVQALWGNPPATGARIITSILCNPALFGEWKQSLKGVVENIMLIKEKVKEKLRLLGTPGSWNHITRQSGTHGYLGLNYQQVEFLVKKKHIYLPKTSRINFTCINSSNIDYITQSIHEAVMLTEG